MKHQAPIWLLVYRSCLTAGLLCGVSACSEPEPGHEMAAGSSDQQTAGNSSSAQAASTTGAGAGADASAADTAAVGSQTSAGGAPVGTDGAQTGMGGATTTGPDYPDIEFVYDPDKDLDPVVCAEQTLSAEPLPLDMYIVLDRTGSMIEEMPAGEDCQLGAENPPTFNTKWCKATQALSQYFTAAATPGYRAALQFMIPSESTSIECEATDENLHARAEVDLTELPSTIDGPLVAALAAAVADNTSTAIESALNGIAMYTADNSTPGRQMIGVLVTDGDPTFCSKTLSTLAAIPESHFESTGIPTFIIGMTGADPAMLEALAEDGGGPEHSEFCDPSASDSACHYWSVADGDPAAFVAALEAIQASVTGCEFAVPSTDAGLVDLDTVRVELSADVSVGEPAPEPVELIQVESEGGCSDSAYLRADVNGVPTIRLCPAACDALSGTASISVTVECEGS